MVGKDVSSRRNRGEDTTPQDPVTMIFNPINSNNAREHTLPLLEQVGYKKK